MTHHKLSHISSLLVEIKNPGRKGSRLPLWHMEVSALGEKPAWTDFQEAIDLSGKAWPHDAFVYQSLIE